VISVSLLCWVSEVAEHSTVLIFSDPARGLRDLLDVGPERRSRLPARTVMQRVQFMARQAEPGRQADSHRGLPRPGDPPTSTRSIGLPCSSGTAVQ
jgi:hypothetical protein